MLVELPMKPMSDAPLMIQPRTPLPVHRWCAATLHELALAGWWPHYRDEVSGRPYALDTHGRRWLLDGSGDVA